MVMVYHSRLLNDAYSVILLRECVYLIQRDLVLPGRREDRNRRQKVSRHSACEARIEVRVSRRLEEDLRSYFY